jgi:excisionase family DNA binding protein
MDDRLLTRKEAAAMLGISPDTLAYWKCKKKNHLPIVRVGSLAQYKISDLHRFVKERVERVGG